MVKEIPFVSLVNEETAHLKWFEAFMRGRVELEQQMISGLQALLEGADSKLLWHRLPDSKLLWHRSFEKLLDGTRDELHARIEELEGLKYQMQHFGTYIANAKMYFRDLDVEVGQLESREGVDSAQAATASLHKDWLEIKSVDVSVQKGLSDLFSSGRTQRKKLDNEKFLKAQEERKALEKYYNQDLRYRHIISQQREGREQFLSSIPDRVQEYGTKYWTAVCDVGMVMESFANYLRNISSTCNSSGSAIWASAKDIKPLVDANCHTEAIEFAYHRSPIRFSPIHYRNHESKSHSPSGDTMLFGCPLPPKKIPPFLGFLLDSVRDWPNRYFPFRESAIDEKGRIYSEMWKYWFLVNQLEQAWTGVEESDRAIISKLIPQVYQNQGTLIMVYFWALPKPVWSNDAIRNPSSLNWNTWDNDPTKLAVLRAILSCRARLLYHGENFGADIAHALAQQYVPFSFEDAVGYLDYSNCVRFAKPGFETRATIYPTNVEGILRVRAWMSNS